MFDELNRFLVFMRPAFSRRATYCWFVVVFIGLIMRSDTYGVSSIIRALRKGLVSTLVLKINKIYMLLMQALVG